jgi:hypothetical protein
MLVGRSKRLLVERLAVLARGCTSLESRPALRESVPQSSGKDRARPSVERIAPNRSSRQDNSLQLKRQITVSVDGRSQPSLIASYTCGTVENKDHVMCRLQAEQPGPRFAAMTLADRPLRENIQDFTREALLLPGREQIKSSGVTSECHADQPPLLRREPICSRLRLLVGAAKLTSNRLPRLSEGVAALYTKSRKDDTLTVRLFAFSRSP